MVGQVSQFAKQVLPISRSITNGRGLQNNLQFPLTGRAVGALTWKSRPMPFSTTCAPIKNAVDVRKIQPSRCAGSNAHVGARSFHATSSGMIKQPDDQSGSMKSQGPSNETLLKLVELGFRSADEAQPDGESSREFSVLYYTAQENDDPERRDLANRFLLFNVLEEPIERLNSDFNNLFACVIRIHPKLGSLVLEHMIDNVDKLTEEKLSRLDYLITLFLVASPNSKHETFKENMHKLLNEVSARLPVNRI